MTKAESRRELFERYLGPELQLAELGTFAENFEPLTEHVEYILEQFQEHQPYFIKEIYVGYIDDLSVNAVAFSNGKTEVVGLNAGLAIGPVKFMFWLMSHPTVFTDIGDIEIESEPDPFDLDILIAPNSLPETDPQSIVERTVPKDSRRSSFAIYMTMLFWEFVVLHEFAHLNRGHIRLYQRHSRGSSSLNALSEFEKDQDEDFRFTQLLEIDADRIAGASLARSVQADGYSRTKRVIGDQGQTRTGDGVSPSKAYEFWIRSMAMIFMIMSLMDSIRNPMSPDRSHPHPLIRLNALLHALKYQIAQELGSEEEFHKVCERAVGSVYSVFETGIIPNPKNLNLLPNDDEMGDRISQLFSSLGNFTEELDDFMEERWERVSEPSDHLPIKPSCC